nr:type II/IV secretion system ATPase subunit [Salarchaeum japonicum]
MSSPPEVPAPVPPDAADAWYAPDVHSQYEPTPGVVVTVTRDRNAFRYRVREPVLTAAETDARGRVSDYFERGHPSQPRTREGARERYAAGLDEKHRRAVARLADATPAGERRLRYYALRDVRCLGALTPLALDDRVEVADADGDRLVVHTAEYAPARTDIPADADALDRFLSERLDAYTVPFREFDVPVVVYREHVLGTDAFDVRYAVREPDLLPGDRALLDDCKTHVWDARVGDLVDDHAAFVAEHADRYLARRLAARNAGRWLDTLEHRARDALSAYDLALPPVDRRFADDRLDDLRYYVLRDFVGHGELTVPVRDDHLEDVEANRVGERVKVVPRHSLWKDGRIPTNLVFDDERAFVDLVTQLAAEDGVELNASNPSAKVNLRPDGVGDDVTVRCAVALPAISADGPHVSIRKQAPDALTPTDLVRTDSISPAMVALLWMAYEHHGVVVFSGPTGVGKTTLMNAHAPFIPHRDRPVSIDEGSREVSLPHETGVSLTTRDHENPHKRVTMADLMTESNYLNPDVEIIAEINTPESFETFADVLNTGHGVIGTTHAADADRLVNRVVEQGLPAYLLREIDLVVFPRHVEGERYVGEMLELVDEAAYDRLPADERGRIEKDDTVIHYHRVAGRREGAFSFADAGDVAFFDRLAAHTDRPREAVVAEFERKRRYVEYFVRDDLSDRDDLFAFLADLRTDEAATVERAAGDA